MNTSSYPERLKIDKLSKKGLWDRQVAEQVGLSIHTVRKWRRKLKAGKKMELPRFCGQVKACGLWGTSLKGFVPVG
jgi:transposase